MTDKVSIRRLSTGVPGFDEVLGGGLPEYSFNLIAGGPGCGKTTLAHQIMFALANPDRRAIFFTVLGEPPMKMLRYQQQFAFFDISKVNASIRFISLATDFMDGDFGRVLARIIEEVEKHSPGLVFVDSFRSFMQGASRRPEGAPDLQQFVQQLGVQLTSWQATTFLVGEYLIAESNANPVFTVADGILWLAQSVQGNSMVRKMQIMKMRGQASIPGLHTFRITGAGVQVFPRVIVEPQDAAASPVEGLRPSDTRLATGVPRLDEMLGGGLPSGYSVLLAGPSGSGKTVLANRFLAEGVHRGEPGVIAAFEKTPAQLGSSAIGGLIQTGQIGIVNTRSLDLSIDEILYELTEMISRLKAKRVVIDSLSGFELAVAPTFREDFRESLYRMVAVLTGIGVTVLMTCELEDCFTDFRLSPYGTAFLSDAIILQRYVEIQGQIKRAIAVVKVRASAHSNELRLFEITDDDVVIGEPLTQYEGLVTGRVTPRI